MATASRRSVSPWRMHLGGMYIASPLSGWLADRLGRLPVIGLGGIVLVVALGVAGLVPGSDSGLVMLGPLPERHRLEPRVRRRQRAPHRRAVARGAHVVPGPGRSHHGNDGRARQRGRRDGPRGLGVLGPERAGRGVHGRYPSSPAWVFRAAVAAPSAIGRPRMSRPRRAFRKRRLRGLGRPDTLRLHGAGRAPRRLPGRRPRHGRLEERAGGHGGGGLRGSPDRRGALVRRLADFDVVMALRERTPFPRALFERLPNLKLLITAGMRNASIDMRRPRRARHRRLRHAGLPSPTAELTWGLILSLCRRIPAGGPRDARGPLADDGRARPERQDARRPRARQPGLAGGEGWPRVRDERARVEPEPHAGARGGGGGELVERTSCSPAPTSSAPPRAERAHPRADRRARARA